MLEAMIVVDMRWASIRSLLDAVGRPAVNADYALAVWLHRALSSNRSHIADNKIMSITTAIQSAMTMSDARSMF